MKTLSANLITLLEKNTAEEWLYIVKVAWSNSAASGSYYFSTKHFTITDSGSKVVHGALINDSINVNENIDIRNQVSTVGGFSLSLVDDIGIVDSWNKTFLTEFIYNRSIEIYFGHPDLTALSDWLLVYKGISKDFETVGNKINIKIENSTFTVQKKVPALVTDADAASGQGGVIPAEGNGKSKTIVYGDHRFYFDLFDESLITFSHKNNLTPCVFLGYTLGGNETWLVSSHELNVISDAIDGIGIWGFDSSLGRFVKASYTVLQNTSDGCIINLVTQTFIDRWFPDQTTSSKVETAPGTSTAEVNDEANMVDINNDTLGNVHVISWVGVGSPIAQISLDFSGYTNGGTINNVKFYVKSDFTTDDGATATYTINGANAEALTSSDYTQVGTEASSVAGVNATVPVSLTGNALDTNEHTGEVYMCFKEISYVPNNGGHIPIFAASLGREYSSTWNSRKTAGNLIEHPTDIIESILRDELGQVTAGLNETQLDAVNTELGANWKFSMYLDKQIDTKKLIEKIAKQSMSTPVWDSANKFSIDTFFAANSTARTIKLDEIKDVFNLKTRRTKLKDIVNDLKLNYSLSGQGEFQEQITRVDDRASTGSQFIYGNSAVNELNIDADFIADATTAGLLADHWTKDDADSFWSVDRHIIEVSLPDLVGTNFYDSGTLVSLLELELLDIIEIDSGFDAVMLCNGESWSGLQFKLISVTRSKTTMKFTGYEV